jgi:hypothetical protein
MDAYLSSFGAIQFYFRSEIEAWLINYTLLFPSKYVHHNYFSIIYNIHDNSWTACKIQRFVVVIKNELSL